MIHSLPIQLKYSQVTPRGVQHFPDSESGGVNCRKVIINISMKKQPSSWANRKNVVPKHVLLPYGI